VFVTSVFGILFAVVGTDDYRIVRLVVAEHPVTFFSLGQPLTRDGLTVVTINALAVLEFVDRALDAIGEFNVTE
jgi:hypothetical protein